MRLFLGPVGFALIMAVAGCSSSSQAPSRSAADTGAIGPVRPVEVSDENFAENTYKVLFDETPSQDRANLLAGVVRRQLARAQARFQAGKTKAGLAALEGALFLMRKGEFSLDMVRGGTPALQAGAAEVSRLGQEGLAFALYSMLKELLPEGPERRDVEQHLEALKSFAEATRGSGALLSSAADARRAVQRSLYEPSFEAFDGAQSRLIEWLKRALASNAAEMPIQSNVDRDEVLEAYRALRGGGFAMVALYLRHGDAQGALAALDEAGMERSIPPDIREALERCADENSPEAWSRFQQFYDTLAHDPQPILAFDPKLVEGANFGSALALFRSEPGALRSVLPLASMLIDYGMAEVAPLALAAAVVKTPEPDHLGASLALVMNAIIHEAELGQIDAARRTFANAKPIFDLAEERQNRGRVNPSPARLRYVLAALEAQRGEIERARPLLESAAAEQPTPEVLSTLAAVERQSKNQTAALELLAKVGDLGQKAGDEALAGEADFQRFEIYRDAGDAVQAQTALEAALRHALAAQRQSQTGANQARAERLLARVLTAYGERAAADRATVRAYESAGADGRQLTATIFDASRRALVTGNLQSGRKAALRALEAGLPGDEMVYVALWLLLLERKSGVPSDGTVEEALASFDEANNWYSKLRSWARGKLDDAGLLAVAQGRVEKTEALFYVAMNRYVRGDKAALADLKKVAESEAYDLYEVGIARDILAGERPIPLRLPANVTLP